MIRPLTVHLLWSRSEKILYTFNQALYGMTEAEREYTMKIKLDEQIYHLSSLISNLFLQE